MVLFLHACTLEADGSGKESTVTVSELKGSTLTLRAPLKAIGGAGDKIIDLKGQSGELDAGFRCHAYDLRAAITQDTHIHKIVPHVSQAGSKEIVHHMDIFVCQEAVERSFPASPEERNSWCSEERFIEEQKVCSQMIWAYDRGALTYTFPPDVGIRLGPSTGYTHLMLQIHYLMPVHFPVGQGQGILDSSGFDLIVGGGKLLDSHLLGFLDMGLVLPPHKSRYHFTAHLSSADLANTIGPDFARFGEVQPFAAHLHAHDHAKAVWLDHYRSGKKIGEYASIEPFHGYGPDQTFIPIPKGAPPLRPGDSLSFTCLFDTSAVENQIEYGVSHGDEMCAPLILYYPHVKNAINMNNVRVFQDHVVKTDASEAKVMGIIKSKYQQWLP
jgi:dopamine beta-monooxygenase